MSLTFNPGEIPTESEAVMLANFPPAGQLFYFFNSDKGGNIYSIDSNGNIVFVANLKKDDCACCLSKAWLEALNEALNNGTITANQYNAAIGLGFTVNSIVNGDGSYIFNVSSTLAFPTSITITPGSSTVAVSATLQLAINPTPALAYTGVIWVSSNPSHATVNQLGLVTGVATGTAVITAYSVLNGTITNSITITVP